jgi:hypothetical protein
VIGCIICKRGILDRGTDAFARFLHRRIGETDDGKAGLSIGDIDFDVDERTVESDYRAARHLGKHRCTPL